MDQELLFVSIVPRSQVVTERKLIGNIKLISIFCAVCIDGGGGNIKHKDIPITRSPAPGKNSVFS